MAEVLNEFASDAHRRVGGNLAQPRSARELAAFLAKLDPHVPDEVYSEAGVLPYLEDLEADGLVKRLGAFEDGEALVAAIAKDKALPTLPAEKAKTVAARAASPRVGPYPDEEQWYITQAFLDRLDGPTPSSPEGQALLKAQREEEG